MINIIFSTVFLRFFHNNDFSIFVSVELRSYLGGHKRSPEESISSSMLKTSVKEKEKKSHQQNTHKASAISSRSYQSLRAAKLLSIVQTVYCDGICRLKAKLLAIALMMRERKQESQEKVVCLAVSNCCNIGSDTLAFKTQASA